MCHAVTAQDIQRVDNPALPLNGGVWRSSGPMIPRRLATSSNYDGRISGRGDQVT